MTSHSHSDFTFEVLGVPVPQGSKNAYNRGGRIVLVEASRDLPHWRQQIIEAAQLANGTQPPFTKPIHLDVVFWLPKPAKPKFDTPGVKPDLDKLVRAVGDALTQSGVIKDDCLITSVFAEKRYAHARLPGAKITIR